MCRKIPGSVYDNEVKQTLVKFKRSTKGMLLLNATAHQRSYSSQRFGYNHGIKKTPAFSKFRSPKEHHGVALRVFTSHLSISDSLFFFPPFLNPFPQRPGEWLMNYFTAIRSPAGQTTQPQSCAFLPGYHWKRSTLNCPSLSAKRVWANSNNTAITLPETSGFA
ncbi:hypothetical protein AVEN_205101-1 [Araneus ventricosus]|uniref:Uncharacterized protein n=1 Tax=Araneus ventricosus TaxID=182803 RepID=A0A4Y2MY50_ARAVE|nr:hypothetical protein AVEN_205101-1 [Araneus ventricosus]